MLFKNCYLKYEYKLLNTIHDAIDILLEVSLDIGLDINIITLRFLLNTLGARKGRIRTPSNYNSDYQHVIDECKAKDYISNNKKVTKQFNDFKGVELQHYGINEQKELTGYILEYDYFNKSVPGNYKSLEDFENDITEAKRKIQCGEKVSKKKWDKLKHAYREIKFTKRDESEQ